MKILLAGSVAFDYIMKFPGIFKDHIIPERLDTLSLSFLVESLVRLRGGIAPNIAYTLALLGERPSLWATVGEDFEEYRQWLEAKGVDTSGARVIPGETTASFFVNTDRANAQIASFYPGAMAYSAQLSLKELDLSPGSRPDIVMISPTDPQAMIQYVQECKQIGLDYIYDPSQQIVRLTAADICEGIQGCRALFVNDYEFALIERITCWSVEQMLEGSMAEKKPFIVVTRGKQGISIYSEEGTYEIPAFPVEHISDPTGVGDAFRGGFLSGYSHDLDLEICGQMGSVAATYCLEQRGPQGHTFTIQQFITRFREYFDDHGKLDCLLPSVASKVISVGA